MIESLSTATPFEVDTELARLDGEYGQLNATWSAAIDSVHRQLGERKIGRGRSRMWPTSWQTATTLLKQKLDANEPRTSQYEPARAAELLGQLADLNAKMGGNRAEADVLDAEYNRRPWTRFFLVISSDGHIHRNTSCSSFPRTQHGWQPELSGKSEEEAVAKLGPRMCSKCFPSAPVEWTRGVEKQIAEGYCSGQGKWALETQMQYVSPRGVCPECGSRTIGVSRLGKVLKHKPAEKKSA